MQSWPNATEKAPPSGGAFFFSLGLMAQRGSAVWEPRHWARPATGPPLCKGSCRRTPTEGLTASHRTQAVLPHPTIENQLNHSPGFAIPPDMAAAPRRHKGGLFFGPVPGRSYSLCLSSYNLPFLMHLARTSPRPLPGLARQHRSNMANSASPPETGTGAEALRLDRLTLER